MLGFFVRGWNRIVKNLDFEPPKSQAMCTKQSTHTQYCPMQRYATHEGGGVRHSCKATAVLFFFFNFSLSEANQTHSLKQPCFFDIWSILPLYLFYTPVIEESRS